MNIFITGGSTTETIDGIAVTTKMCTGELAKTLAKDAALAGHRVTLFLHKVCHIGNDETRCGIELIRFSSAAHLLALMASHARPNIDIVVHTAEASDYTPEYIFTLEDLAKELFGMRHSFQSSEDIFSVLVNPACKTYGDSTASNVQSSLAVKLSPTQEVISHLRELYPETYIVGLKSLDGVARDTLINAAKDLGVENKLDFVLANDLANLRQGKTAYVGIMSDNIGVLYPENIIDYIVDIVSRPKVTLTKFAKEVCNRLLKQGYRYLSRDNFGSNMCCTYQEKPALSSRHSGIFVKTPYQEMPSALLGADFDWLTPSHIYDIKTNTLEKGTLQL